MVHHAIKGALGMLPQQALIFDYDIGNHCLLFLFRHFDNICQVTCAILSAYFPLLELQLRFLRFFFAA